MRIGEKWGLEMAISEEKIRVSITMPKDGIDVIREEAKHLNLTVSQYVYLTMMANSFLADGRLGDLAANQLQVLRDRAWGYEVDELHANAPALV